MHRAQVRAVHGFREPTVEDEDRLAGWLAIDACSVELSEDRLREAVLARCRAKRSEPPGSSRVERILGNVFRLAEAALEQPDESVRKALNHTSS